MKYWNMKEEKGELFKNGLKNDRRFFPSGSAGRFKIAVNVLLFRSASRPTLQFP